MLMFDGVFGLIALGVWIFCIIDAITTPADKVRNLPKVVWVLIVILLTFPGSIVWLVAGRPWGPKRAAGGSVRAAPRSRPTNPDDDVEFLASLQARADEQRRRARETQTRDDDKPGEPAS
jgi:Phospholipase_D-nuclease N-terminal